MAEYDKLCKEADEYDKRVQFIVDKILESGDDNFTMDDAIHIGMILQEWINPPQNKE